MQVSMIGCPFITSYGAYIQSLASAITKKTGNKVQWIASNCGCGDPVERTRLFQTTGYDYFEMPVIHQSASTRAWKRWIRNSASNFCFHIRARRISMLQRSAHVVHFQQILNAFGSNVVFHWLRLPTASARVVTVHELDDYQLQHRDANQLYNRADALIVHCDEMKHRLVALNVQSDRIHVVRHGTDIPTPQPLREGGGLIFYGGHNLMKGKGVETLFKALSIIVDSQGVATPRLSIHGHYGTEPPVEALQLAKRYQIMDRIDWLNQIPVNEIHRQYQSAALCILPYSGSFAGLPAGIAAANGLPVVGTRKAGLPDHLGEDGVWIDEANPEQLAQKILQLLGNEPLRRQISSRLRRKADELLSWDVIAQHTLDVYWRALAQMRPRSTRLPDTSHSMST